MSDPTPVAGDGVITIPGAVTGVDVMDISPNFGSLLMNESAADVKIVSSAYRAQFQLLNSALGAQIIEDAREVGMLEGKTASNLYATPSASPVKQG